MVRVIAKRYFSTTAIKDKELLPTLFSTHGKLDHLPIIIIAFISRLKRKMNFSVSFFQTPNIC